MTWSDLSRRALIGGLAAGLGGAAWADGPVRSLIPVPRPFGDTAPAGQDPRDIVAETALPGVTGFMVADARTGEILDQRDADRALPTASVAKIVTAQYALDTFGPDHRFTTRVLVTAPITDGRVDGDLVLAGGGDPMLDSDDLAAMVKSVMAAGLKEVTGRVLVHRGGLPRIPRIDAGQPPHASYNPGVSGLNLNFNRVYFEWKKEGGDYLTRMDARGAKVQPEIALTRMAVVDRRGPVYDYQTRSGYEDWSVARAALGKEGAQWLPVRNPALYAGYAMQALLAGAGIRLGGDAPQVTRDLPQGIVIANNASLTMDRIIRSMLYFSTNLIAEVLGLDASIARGGTPNNLPNSAAIMNRWVGERFSASGVHLLDHSGLGDSSRATPRGLVQTLVGVGPDGVVGSKLRRHPMPEQAGGLPVLAKTGTLNFVSGLAGFADTGRRMLAFAILACDMDARRAIPAAERDRPRGAKAWANRARYQENRLIMDWARRFA